MQSLDIGEVSAKSGIKPSALRYYEEAGLISAISRHGLRRQFPPKCFCSSS
jgi:DNA-binding transcriptional MerR regulator